MWRRILRLFAPSTRTKVSKPKTDNIRVSILDEKEINIPYALRDIVSDHKEFIKEHNKSVQKSRLIVAFNDIMTSVNVVVLSLAFGLLFIFSLRESMKASGLFPQYSESTKKKTD